MKTLLDLAKMLENKSSAIDKDASDHAVKVANAVVQQLAYQTPVDTSKALSNWIVTLDIPSMQQIEPHFPGEKGSTQNLSAGVTVGRSENVLGDKKPGQKIFIRNNQPYVPQLDWSHSQAGFVERALLVGRKIALKFKLRK